MQKATFNRTSRRTLAAATMLAVTCAVLPVHAQGANAAPFGLEIGVASCDSARSKLASSSEKKLGDGDVLLYASKPADLFPGAQSMFARCSANKVIALGMDIAKGGMGNPKAREVYSFLDGKYKRVAGAPMPNVGNGYARFTSGATVIEQDAPHMSFNFSVTFFSKGFYDYLVIEDEKKAQQKKQAKASAL